MHPNVGTATLMWDLREIEQKKLQQKNSACGLHGVDIHTKIYHYPIY